MNQPDTYANPTALVEVATLAAGSDSSIRLIEVSTTRRAYDDGHIRGACWWDWGADLRDAHRNDLVGRAGLESLLSRSGVTADTRLVLYGDVNNSYATYAYWVLRLRGYQRLTLLNGSKSGWAEQVGRWSRSTPELQPTDYRLPEPDLESVRADKQLVSRRIGAAIVLDVRSCEEYAGLTTEPEGTMPTVPMRAGHIPTAVHAPWTMALREDGVFKTAIELRQAYGALGIRPDREVLVYCRSGRRSSHTWFVLSELLGHPAVRNYDASWLEWGSCPDTPIERTAVPGP